MSAALPFLVIQEALKFYVPASYCFYAVGRPLPLVPALLVLMTAFVVTKTTGAMAARVIFRFLIHAGFLAASYLVLLNIFRRAPVSGGIEFPADSRETIDIIAIAAWTVIYWFRGFWIGRRPLNHAFCVNRFDEGLGIFLFVLSLGALTGFDNPTVLRLIVPYFVFSILALGFTRNDQTRRGGLSRRSRGKMLLPVAAAFIAASACVVFLIPVFFAPAKTAGAALAGGLRAAKPYVEAFLRFLFGFRRSGPAAEAASSSAAGIDAPAAGSESPLIRLVELITLWTLGAVAAVLSLALLGYFLAKLLRHLASRAEKRGEGIDLSFLPAWLRALLWRFAAALGRWNVFIDKFIAERRRTLTPAAAAYRRLLAASRAAGASRLPTETPREFTRRLAAAFPRTASDAEFAAESLEKEAYGLLPADPADYQRFAALRRRARGLSFLAERARRALTSGRRRTEPKGK